MLKWISRWDAPPDGPALLERLLKARGFDDPASVQAFLHPDQSQLIDPFLMRDMQGAVQLICKARDRGLTVAIYGDYDVDGVTATAIMTGFLTAWGVRTRHYIPSRHREGYGLNEEAVRGIAQDSDTGLLITVDCGITSAAHIELARSLGLEAIVTDHHRPGEEVPGCPVLNPLMGYPYPSLCGAGVAFKLCQALDEDLAMDFIDLAALGTVADVVPLTGENRAIARLGIGRMNECPRPGIEALRKAAGIADAPVTAGRIGFQIAPRLNAGGRVGDANRSLRLLTSETQAQAQALADELEQENSRRKLLEKAILSEAAAQLEGSFDFAARRCIVLADEDWNAGVLGLAAGRIAERYTLPTVLLRREGEVLHGSCRSVPGVDIFRALSAVSGHLTRFGGHSQAAGLTLPAEGLPAFRQALDETIAREADPECFVPSARYDMQLPLSDLDEAFVRSLAYFEPTGFGNPAPVFRTDAAVESAEAVGAKGAHLRLRLREGGRSLPGIAFSMGGRAGSLPQNARVLYAPRMGAYKGRAYVECQVKALEHSRYLDALCPDMLDFDGLFQTFLTNRLYNKEYSTPPSGHYAGYAAIFKRLCASPRGAVLLAATEEAARAFLDAAQREAPDRLDVFSGRWPDDPRAFNALCLLPPGAPPAGYDAIFSLDAPAALWGFPVLEPRRAPPAPEALWPDVDALRATYVAARELSRRPFRATALREIVREMEKDLGLTAGCVFAGLQILTDMNLIALCEAPPKIVMRPPRKVDPTQNALFQWTRRIFEWGR